MLSVSFRLILPVVFLLVSSCSEKRTEGPKSETVPKATNPQGSDSVKFATYVRPLPANRISPYDHIIKKYSRRFGFDWRLIAAQIYAESHFRPNSRSPAGAIGLMQVLPNTAKHLGLDPQLLLKPEHNISIGCLYDRRLYDLWNDKKGKNRLAFTLASYNAGRRTVLKSAARAPSAHRWELVKPHLPKETQRYVTKIFRQYQLYKRRYF